MILVQQHTRPMRPEKWWTPVTHTLWPLSVHRPERAGGILLLLGDGCASVFSSHEHWRAVTGWDRK